MTRKRQRLCNENNSDEQVDVISTTTITSVVKPFETFSSFSDKKQHEDSNENTMQDFMKMAMRKRVVHEESKTLCERVISQNKQGVTQVVERTFSHNQRREECHEIILEYRQKRHSFTNMIKKEVQVIIDEVKGIYDTLNDIPDMLFQMELSGKNLQGNALHKHCALLIQSQIDAEFEREHLLARIEQKVEEHRELLRIKPPFITISNIDKSLLDGQMVTDYIVNNGNKKNLFFNSRTIVYNDIPYPIDNDMKMMLEVHQASPKSKEQFIAESIARRKWQESRESWRKMLEPSRTKTNDGKKTKTPSQEQMKDFIDTVEGKSWNERRIALAEFMTTFEC
jgi:hypothetical protein